MLGPVIFCSLILLFSFHYSDMPYSISTQKKIFELSHLSPNEKIIVKGLVFGEKPRKKDLRVAIKNLHIYHLFTPSGLHLSSLLWFLSFFSLKRMALFGLLPLVVLLDGFLAFKRVYFIKFIGELLQVKKVYIDSRYIFFFVFLLEFIFRIHLSPLSFTYSFLFLGIIYSLKNSSPMVLLVGLWFGQSLISCFREDSIYLLSLPLNSILSFLVTVSYPLILLNTFIPIGLGNYFYDLILIFNSFLVTWSVQVNTTLLVVLLAMVLIKKVRKVGAVVVGFISTVLY